MVVGEIRCLHASCTILLELYSMCFTIPYGETQWYSVIFRACHLQTFDCLVGVWVIEQHAMILSATVRSPTVSFISAKYMKGYSSIARFNHRTIKTPCFCCFFVCFVFFVFQNGVKAGKNFPHHWPFASGNTDRQRYGVLIASGGQDGQDVEQTVQFSMIWDAMMLVYLHFNVLYDTWITKC